MLAHIGIVEIGKIKLNIVALNGDIHIAFGISFAKHLLHIGLQLAYRFTSKWHLTEILAQVELDGSIIGCGAIGPFWGKEDESSLFTIFVLPEHQGKGVGRLIINTLEKDEFFQRAKRVEIPASITGVPFYLKMGYNYKDGITDPDEEHLIRLEKIR